MIDFADSLTIRATKSSSSVGFEIRLAAIITYFAIAYASIIVALLFIVVPEIVVLRNQLEASLSYFVSVEILHIIETTIIIFLAYCLFLVRENHLRAYAIMEVGFGVSSVWYSLGSRAEPFQKGLAILASSYILVRGWTNLKESHKKLRLPRVVKTSTSPLAKVAAVHAPHFPDASPNNPR